MTAPNWLSWIENTLLVPGSPESMALTTQSTSPDVRFVRAVPQTKRVPVGWCSMPAPTIAKKYAVMRVHCPCGPPPRSVYSRWPQVGEPPLPPPATPKFALAPPGRMMNPPPVRKSHVDWALAEPPASTSVATPAREALASTTVLQDISRSPARVHTSDRGDVAATRGRGVRTSWRSRWGRAVQTATPTTYASPAVVSASRNAVV